MADFPPVKLINTHDFVKWCRIDQPRLYDLLARWDRLYTFCSAEYCERRQHAFKRCYNKPISSCNSLDLCLAERYTACVNFKGRNDGVVRHICDMLPIVIGSNLDRQVRHDFWASDIQTRQEDQLKIGLLVQNKNFYNFTTTMVTNPKVAHIYRKNNKLHKLDSRVYYYDENFRGNMFYFEQSVVLLRCTNCETMHATCSGLRCLVVEELFLRNCFKQDYLLLRRFCNASNRDTTSHKVVAFIISRYVQQRDKIGGLILDQHDLSQLLKQLGTCLDVLQRYGSIIHVSDSTFDSDLQVYDPSITSHARDRIHIRLTNERDLTRLLLCDCEHSTLETDYNNQEATRVNPETGSFLRVDNIEEFKRISLSCFMNTQTDHHEQLFTLYCYMRQVMLRNEDIDELCNKCIFDGPYLYNKLMRQLREYLCERLALDDLCTSADADTLIARYRQLAHTANLYMLISSKTNIRVDMANDLKRSLKLSVKREKMQQTDFSMTVKSSDMRDYLQMQQPTLAAPTTTTLTTSHEDSPTAVSAAGSLFDVRRREMDVNEKCDFVLRSANTSRFKHLFSGLVPSSSYRTDDDVIMSDHDAFELTGNTVPITLDDDKLYLASCGENDFNTRQLITYDSQNLLQNVASAHFTDLEFIFEQVKRPRVTNQQNSSKCALMPRQPTRFLSFYNIGNMSVAGRTMNICARNRVTFFVHRNTIACKRFYEWINVVYATLVDLHDRSIDHCLRHNVMHCPDCYYRLMINEMPCSRLRIDASYEFILFVLIKYYWPAVQFYRKADRILSVTLISGVIVVPMTLILDDERHRQINPSNPNALRYDLWQFCDPCRRYYPLNSLDRSSNLFYVDAPTARILRAFNTTYHARHFGFLSADGGIEHCSSHTWFSSNDMQYYEMMLSRQTFSTLNDRSLVDYQTYLANPRFYEIACHGLFLNSKFVDATDISKLTVSINASKRRLRSRATMPSDNLETLIDQNMRMYVSQWQQPVNGATSVRNVAHNTFRCFFMFGDLRGRNCEDAYVFDRESQPLLTNTIQLKVNYYRQDKSPVNPAGLRFHFAPSVSVYDDFGSIFFFGYLISRYRLSFGSTFVYVKTVRVGAHLWMYKFYYTNSASYLRTGERVFSDDNGGDTNTALAMPNFSSDSSIEDDHFDLDRLGPAIVVNENQVPLQEQQRRSKNTTFTINRLLAEYSSTSANGRLQFQMQMTNRQLRFVMVLRDIRAVQKLQNNCGQKGVTSYDDLSDLYTSDNERVHVIVSLYSMNGRQLLSQLLEQYSNGGTHSHYGNSTSHLPLQPVFSHKQGGKQVGWGGYGDFFFSCDSPHDNIIVSSPNYGSNAIRMCNMTFFAAIGNNLSTWIANRSADHVNYRNNPINGIPANVYQCLSVYHYYNRQLYPYSLLTRELRKKIRDWYELRQRGVIAKLPTSITLSS